MGNKGSLPEDENSNRFKSMDGPQMPKKALTFDERKLLSVASRPKQGPSMKRAQTFVGKSSVVQHVPYQLQDVMYRKHFERDDERHTVNILPVSDVTLEFPDEVFEPSAEKNEAVIVVDTFSTGAFVSHISYTKGYKVICVLSGNLESLLDMVPEGLNFAFSNVLTLDSSVDQKIAFANLVSEINNLNLKVVAVMAGAETGVELADQLSSHMGLRTNGTELSEARRNKYVMGETVRSAGVRAVKQLHASTWAPIEAYLEEWKPNPFKVIVKPMDSAGSDDVTLCLSMEDVQAAFGNIIGKRNGLGLINKSVLVQEYLEGTEYVVDAVSKNGEHKVVTIWEYDRRPANDAGFVVYGQRQKIISDDPEKFTKIVEYQKQVITALGFREGPSHGEVKWMREEPVLVEVGARCHGSDGLWVGIAEEATGQNQAKCMVEMYLEEEGKFENLPALPQSREKYCGLKFLVSFAEGTLKSYNQELVDEITSMSSYRGHQFFVKPGGALVKTINCFTQAGCVMLVNPDQEAFERDYARIEEIQTSLFNVTVVPEKKVECVAVVDPFSTGASLAAELSDRGYDVIAVYSAKLEQLGNLQNLVPEGICLNFKAVVGFDEDLSVIVENMRAVSTDIIAVFAGAETGVELADQLSTHMHLRTNGIEHSEARRNKYVMGETVRSAGVRAVKQLKATAWADIKAYLEEWNPSPFKVIVKPMDSAGSEGVTLCRSMADAEAAFNKLYGQKNGLGLINKSVLVQEFLEGTEYVVDIVSRDGEHKVTAIWEYDRRPVNGAGFVVFGQSLKIIPDDTDKFTQMVEYQKQVIAALGIRHGPSHGEVKWVNGEPVLVEVGARCHGAEGAWIPVADKVLGCNQPSATIDSYLDEARFQALREMPTERFCDGRLCFLVCRVGGQLKAINPDVVEEIRGMSSFVRMEIFNKLGTNITPTINYFNFGGIVVLLNSDTAKLEADYARIHEIEENMFLV